MSFEPDLHGRLRAMGIDEETRSILRELRPKVAQSIDEAIGAAYSGILSFPEVSKVYQSIDLAAAKRAQKQHWLDDVFSGEFSKTQLVHSVEMGTQRQRAGLELRWYFAFWMKIYCHLLERIAPDYRKRPERLLKVLAALGKAVFFDIEIFTAVFMHAAEGAAAAELGRRADSFERDVADTAKQVATSVAQLKSGAEAMSTVAATTTEKSQAALAAGEQVSSNSQTVAAATEELTSSIQEISRQVNESTG
jgi:methyl-accepting chemotaxis protein